MILEAKEGLVSTMRYQVDAELVSADHGKQFALGVFLQGQNLDLMSLHEHEEGLLFEASGEVDLFPEDEGVYARQLADQIQQIGGVRRVTIRMIRLQPLPYRDYTYHFD